jgi:hypothetical protein
MEPKARNQFPKFKEYLNNSQGLNFDQSAKSFGQFMTTRHKIAHMRSEGNLQDRLSNTKKNVDFMKSLNCMQQNDLYMIETAIGFFFKLNFNSCPYVRFLNFYIHN